MNTTNFTKEEAVLKIKQFCAYRERCEAEVSEKLLSYGLNKKETEEIIFRLTEEKFLNEERFSIQFASGKFNINKWGRIKIKYALGQKHVSDHVIKNALKQIDESDYKKTLNKLAVQKLKTLKSDKNILVKKKQLHDYLLQKGYEGIMIKEVLNKLII